MSGLERDFVVPDCHHPYVDKGAWRVALGVGGEFKPHRVIVMGDFWDGYCISRHRKNPNRNRMLEVEIKAANKALDQLEALKADHCHFIQGNHEESLERYLMDRAPELFNIVTVPGLFNLKARGWTYTPYRDHLKIGRVHYTHDVENAGARAHETAEADYQGNIVIGHTHRASITYSGNVKGDRHVAIMGGWLGDRKMAEYLHKAKKTRHWQHAVTCGYREPNGTTHFQLLPIIAGKACLNGRLIKAAA